MKGRITRNKNFLLLCTGVTASELGGAFGTFTNSVLVYELTGSKLALGTMWLFYYVPSILFQLISGPLIDRWSRKWIMVISQWTRGFIFLLPLIVLELGTLETWHIYTVQIVISFITPLYVPANQALIPTIVSKEQLPAANAVLDGMTRMMLFMAPILGGIVIQTIGTQSTLLLVSSLLLCSGLLLVSLREERITLSIRKSWFGQLKEGIGYFFNMRVIVCLAVFLSFVQFGVGVTMVINLPYITDLLGGDYQDYGYFMAGFPFGYILGSLLIGKLQRFSRRYLMLGSLVIGGFTYIALGVAHSIPLAITIEVAAGVVMAIFSIHNLSICQQTIPNDMMGKIMSVRLAIIKLAMLLGILTGGAVSELWGIRPLYLSIGSIIVLVSLGGMAIPYFSLIDKPTAQRL
ncbi:MFS transporter [Sporosarcina sp. Te-1]|uniref:MFS transporter n=1 Tax=Sporosarcina sp. Te-1 TaxID=2818390 RepID=UPI001A9D65CC|nr:MFS transporter [Sporosarcina sp. Te-1]QTD39756.1 MFS transporter [Sporosarcina sp. Te-1]